MKNVLKKISTFPLYGAFIVPLDQGAQWKHIQFDKIPANNVSFSKSLILKVDKSSSFLVFPLETEKEVESFEIKGKYSGGLNLPEGKEQGYGKADDFAFKFGFILPGEEKLTGVKKWLAPKWVKKVYEMAPKDQGLNHLELFAATTQDKMLGKKRIHPASDFFHEEYSFLLKDSGEFSFEKKINGSLRTLALWLSADGDNSKSSFSIEVTSLKVHFKE
ncbi:MAG: hypothetical protein EP326_04525 [Deltaproteobacteria bacterium]|nr:MAG: hypothetical protein EP326_04525 [Deltaproteobacteria bacterium]TNF31902.1 MAG: hypothetical protein EP319_00770 [Deltaproteobacteria bacterium]